MPSGKFNGEFATSEASRRAVARDFGGIVHRMPRAVLAAQSVDDVVGAVAYARDEGLKLCARGQGHTTRGQSQIEDGLVVLTEGLCDIEVGPGYAVVGAGARWDKILHETLKSGQTPPVLTDYLPLSVGGTLSVGGVGGQSFLYGMQTDNVDELVVVTGAGSVTRCSRRQNTDLFAAVRGGLGQFGVIVEARLRLIKAPEQVVVHNLEYAGVTEFLADQERLAEDERCDYLLGSLVPRGGDWALSLEAVSYVAAGRGHEPGLLTGLEDIANRRQCREQPFEEYANRLDAMVVAMRQSGTWSGRHPWMDLFVSAKSTPELLEHAIRTLDPADLEEGYVMTYPLRTSRSDTPFLGLPSEERAYLFDVLPSIRSGDEQRSERVERACRSLYARGYDIDARVYPIGYPVGSMSKEAWRRQLGSHWSALSAAKRVYDPEGILNGGLGVFFE
jgi:cytokinin dehydrogenase